ncbi:hypothetical protein CDG81_04440 [Actinopolyspora erythraea]|uniref:Uncharacterized protein n=1 Tax=Actinopolyspora erythraea TaxID=414996 RepID=A0A223RP84_9ACTN|nr:hypothetical protein CDG81_04440 [Actinopolyspora erythraea]
MGAPPVTAAPPASAPADNDIRERLKTACDQAWFWSGTVGGKSVKDYAEKTAKANSGLTLAAKLEQEDIPEPAPDDIKRWREYSGYFAEGAKCQVWAVLGNKVNPDSIWLNTELPTLKRNPEVDYVWRVDPQTDLACVLWQKPNTPHRDCYFVKTSFPTPWERPHRRTPDMPDRVGDTAAVPA